MRRIYPGPLIGLVMVALTGCTAYQPRKTVFNPDAPRMSAIYSTATNGVGSQNQRAMISPNPDPGQEILSGYTREAETETTQLFPKVPNPTLVLYVFPHITKGNVPVPGFSTPFPLYRTEHYALPGELQ